MLLDNPSASVWLTPGLNLMSTILYLCKGKAHRINLELCGDIVINHFRQLWSVIIVTGTPNMYRKIFSKRVELLNIPFQQLKICLSWQQFLCKICNWILSSQIIYLRQYSATTELRTVSLKSEWNFQIWWLQKG